MFARNYANGVIKKSKKIQKASQLSTPNKIQKKKNSNIIIPKLENLDQFCHEETHQFQKTKERTYKMIQFDKELLKKALISLQNYSKKNMNVEKKCKYDIFLELKFNKTPSKIPLKCFKM